FTKRESCDLVNGKVCRTNRGVNLPKEKVLKIFLFQKIRVLIVFLSINFLEILQPKQIVPKKKWGVVWARLIDASRFMKKHWMIPNPVEPSFLIYMGY